MGGKGSMSLLFSALPERGERRVSFTRSPSRLCLQCFPQRCCVGDWPELPWSPGSGLHLGWRGVWLRDPYPHPHPNTIDWFPANWGHQHLKESTWPGSPRSTLGPGALLWEQSLREIISYVSWFSGVYRNSFQEIASDLNQSEKGFPGGRMCWAPTGTAEPGGLTVLQCPGMG